MKLRTIPAATLGPVTALLTPYCPDLSPTALVKALRAYAEPDPTTDRPALLTIKQTCLWLGINRSTLHRWIKSEKLSVVKLGGSIRIEESAVKALMEGRADA